MNKGTVLIAKHDLKSTSGLVLSKGTEYHIQRVLSNGDIEITDDLGDPNYFCAEGKRKSNEWNRHFTTK